MMGNTGLEPVTSALSIRPVGRRKSLETARNHRYSREKLVPVADRAGPPKPVRIRWMEDARRTRHPRFVAHRVDGLSALVIHDLSASSASVLSVETDRDIEHAARRLAETAGSPVRVILFGSHARNEAHPGSDLDFLVIEPHVPDRHAEMVRLRSALHDMRRPIDVLVYSDAQVEEWGDAPGTALHTALTEGRVLVEA